MYPWALTLVTNFRHVYTMSEYAEELTENDRKLVAHGFQVVRDGVANTFFTSPPLPPSMRRKRLYKKGEIAEYLGTRHSVGLLLDVTLDMFSFSKRKRQLPTKVAASSGRARPGNVFGG